MTFNSQSIQVELFGHYIDIKHYDPILQTWKLRLLPRSSRKDSNPNLVDFKLEL